MKRVLIVVGTRPEAIKMAPLIKRLQKFEDKIDLRVCVTAQHREMLDQVMEFFDIKPDYDLDLMKPGQNLFDLTADLLVRMKAVLEDCNPHYVLVHGDTTTSTAAGLAAFYFGAPVLHVEAGLRTYDKLAPFPEEINRQLTDRISDHHFAPTEGSKENLLSERLPPENILVTGNTVVDALFDTIALIESSESGGVAEIDAIVDPTKSIVLVTAHRRENFGANFENICLAIKEIARRPDVQVIFPVHPNPKVQEPVFRHLADEPNVTLIEPMSYQPFVWLMNRAKIILTDSGGVQEEAPSLGKPVLVMRDTTERPEAVDAGTALLVGTSIEKITESVFRLVDNADEYDSIAVRPNPYGDGKASDRIVNYLLEL